MSDIIVGTKVINNNKTEIFPDITIDIFNTYIMSGDLNSILNKISWIKNEIIFIDYRYFKLFASKDTYELVICHVKQNLNIIYFHLPLSKHNLISFIYIFNKIFKQLFCQNGLLLPKMDILMNFRNQTIQTKFPQVKQDFHVFFYLRLE